MTKACCRYCKFNRYEGGEFYCDNEESDAYGCETSYDESCDEFMEEEED